MRVHYCASTLPVDLGVTSEEHQDNSDMELQSNWDQVVGKYVKLSLLTVFSTLADQLFQTLASMKWTSNLSSSEVSVHTGRLLPASICSLLMNSRFEKPSAIQQLAIIPVLKVWLIYNRPSVITF